MPGSSRVAERDVLRCADLPPGAAAELLARLGLAAVVLPPGADIPGSHWGAPEAGLIGTRVYLRADTPAHSLLHEAAHAVCADTGRRAALHTDAGGDDLEECAVCYLQVLLAAHLRGATRERILADMDAWGYTFRLGSAAAWFAWDAHDARAWLVARNVVRADGEPVLASAP
jgi:hypothetical protein